MTKFHNIVLSIVTTLVLSTQAQAGSVAGTGGALELTQDMQALADVGDRALSYTKQLQEYGTQLLQYQKQLQQYTNQFKSYKMMLKNIGKLPKSQWQQFENQVLEIKNILDVGKSITYASASFDAKFNNTFKGYMPYFAMAMKGRKSQKPTDFSKEYRRMYKSTSDTINASLKSFGLQEKDLEKDELIMAQLMKQSQTSKGQLSAIQAANQITLHQTTQFKKLQKTIMTQANMQGEYLAMQNNKEALAKARREAFSKDIEKMNHNNDVPMPMD